MKIYSYRRDPYHKEIVTQQAWIDGLGLALSCVKIFEVLVLRTYHAMMLSWVTLGTWMFFLLAGSILMAHHHSTALIHPMLVDTIVSDTIPIPSRHGGTRKIVLGIPRAERHDLVWKVVWGLSAIV